MSFELASYIVYFFVGLVVSLVPRTPNKTIIVVWIALTLTLFLSVRMKEPQWDIVTYELYSRMIDSYSFFILREFLYFRILQYLTMYFGFEGALLLFDLFVIIVVGIVFYREKLPAIFYFGYFINFQVIMGYQNIHRQFVAEVFCMLLMSLFIFGQGRSRNTSASAAFLAAPFFHNVSLAITASAFASLFSKYRKTIYFFGAILGLLAVNILKNAKSGQVSGFNFAPFFYAIFVVGTYRYYKKIGSTKPNSKRTEVVLAFCCLVGAISIFSLSVAASERVMHFLLVTFYPWTVLGLLSFVREKRIASTVIVSSFFIVIFFVPASKFLFT